MMGRSKKWLSILAIIALLVPVLSGCLSKETGGPSNEPKVLRVMGDSEEWLRREWTQLYEISHPNVTLEFINMQDFYRNQGPDQEYVDPFERMKETMMGPNPPDLIFLNDYYLPQMIEENLLLPLEPFIDKDKFDIENIAPIVREGIRNMGDGTLYALAPNFSSTALVYNKTYFLERGVNFPEDKMTWEEIFNLARSLQGEKDGEKVYGLSLGWGDPYWGLQQYYLQTMGLTVFDEDFTTVNVDTPQWQRAWQNVIDLINEDVLAPEYDWMKAEQEGRYTPFADHDFISGRAAMMVINYNDIRWINDVFSGQYYYGEENAIEPIEWDVVTLPVHPENTGIGGGFYMNGLMGINANAQNSQTAWEFIRYMNSEQVAKVRAKSGWDMVSRIDLIEPPAGLDINMQAFYLLEPMSVDNNRETNELYRKFEGYHEVYEMYSINEQEFQAARNGEKTVQEALAEYQFKAQELLDRLNEKLSNNEPTDNPIDTFEGGAVDVEIDVDVDVDTEEPETETEEGNNG